jgi:hypothetical protein
MPLLMKQMKREVNITPMCSSRVRIDSYDQFSSAQRGICILYRVYILFRILHSKL